MKTVLELFDDSALKCLSLIETECRRLWNGPGRYVRAVFDGYRHNVIAVDFDEYNSITKQLTCATVSIDIFEEFCCREAVFNELRNQFASADRITLGLYGSRSFSRNTPIHSTRSCCGGLP